MNEDLHQPHDKFFKSMFSTPEVARQHLTAFLPQYILEKADLSGIEADPTSYVSKELKSYYSDVVWNVPCKDTKLKFAFLFEHKSDPSPYIYFQLLRYKTEMWFKRIDNNEEPFPIIATVIYQSGKVWKMRSFTDMFKHFDPIFLPFTPVFEFLRVDTTKENEQVLLNMNAYHAFLVSKAMRQARERSIDEESIILIMDYLGSIPNTPAKVELSDRILFYTLSHSELTLQEILFKLQQLSQKNSNYMSTLEQLYLHVEVLVKDKYEAQGKARGKAEGKAEGEDMSLSVVKLYLKGISVAEIAEKMQTSVEKVTNIITKFEAE